MIRMKFSRAAWEVAINPLAEGKGRQDFSRRVRFVISSNPPPPPSPQRRRVFHLEPIERPLPRGDQVVTRFVCGRNIITVIISHRPRDGSAVSFFYCMNDPNQRVTWQATSDDENSSHARRRGSRVAARGAGAARRTHAAHRRAYSSCRGRSAGTHRSRGVSAKSCRSWAGAKAA
jgi:hypothetical protein